MALKPEDELVDALTFVPDAVLDVRYATADNFTGRALYPRAAVYLRRGTAERLARAAQILRGQGLRLRLFDGYRPVSVHQEMWKARPDPRFVADPARGSKHSRGCAVDAGLCGADGAPVPMPSDFDDFARGASPWPHAAPWGLRNLGLLQAAMKSAGFAAIDSEWWHFVDPDGESAPALDVPFPTARN